MAKKKRSLYFTDRTEYNRRKKISASLKKHYAKVRRIAKKEGISAKASATLKRNKPGKPPKVKRKKEVRKKKTVTVLLNDERPHFEVHWLLPSGFIEETGYKEGKTLSVNVSLKLGSHLLIESKKFRSYEYLVAYLTELNRRIKPYVSQELSRIQSEYNISASFLMFRYQVETDQSGNYSINISYQV